MVNSFAILGPEYCFGFALTSYITSNTCNTLLEGHRKTWSCPKALKHCLGLIMAAIPLWTKERPSCALKCFQYRVLEGVKNSERKEEYYLFRGVCNYYAVLGVLLSKLKPWKLEDRWWCHGGHGSVGLMVDLDGLIRHLFQRFCDWTVPWSYSVIYPSMYLDWSPIKCRIEARTQSATFCSAFYLPCIDQFTYISPRIPPRLQRKLSCLYFI